MKCQDSIQLLGFKSHLYMASFQKKLSDKCPYLSSSFTTMSAKHYCQVKKRSFICNLRAALSRDRGEPLEVTSYIAGVCERHGSAPRSTGAHAKHRRWKHSTGSSFTSSLSHELEHIHSPRTRSLYALSFSFTHKRQRPQCRSSTVCIWLHH